MAMAYSSFVIKDPGGKTFADRVDLSDGENIPPDAVLGNSYCIPADIDLANRRIVLAESAPDIDLTHYAFLSQAHGEVTRRFLCIDFDELETLIPRLPVAEKIIFIANCARSGSTLLQKMLNEVDCVAALGEPNFILSCRLLREFSSAEADGVDVSALLSGCMKILCAQWPDKIVSVDLRASEMQMLAELQAIHPNTSTVMIYRDAISVGASWKHQLSKWDPALKPPTTLDDWLPDPETRAVIERWATVHDHASIPEAVGILSLWIHAITGYLDAEQQAQASFSIRYADLLASPERIMHEVLSRLDLDTRQVPATLGVMASDSQAGTVMARSDNQQNEVRLSDDEIGWIHEVLALHPLELSAGMELPGTVTLTGRLPEDQPSW